jgi:hypothetical protein
MLERFIDYRPQAPTRAVIDQANSVIAEFTDQGFKLTLRQLFYQFVARGWLQNTMREYKRLGRIIRDARDGGLVDWDAFEDRTREVNNHASWDGPEEIITSAADIYRAPIWSSQDYRPEVWIEKEALVGVIEGICRQYRVLYFAHRGNNSQTLQHEAGKRFAEYFELGLIPVVLHLADHDPNGIDMTRDNIERLKRYAGREVEVRRIALNMDQVRAFDPPPSFVKDTDTPTSGYRDRFGTDECWELDALSPAVIANLISTELYGMIDRGAWGAEFDKEARERNLLASVAENWTEVKNLIEGRRGPAKAP